MSHWFDRTLLDEILVAGIRDWVDDAWVYSTAAQTGLDDGSQLRSLSIGLIAELLIRRLMIAGDVRGGEHVPWGYSTAGEAIERITREWLDWGDSLPTPGAIVWLDSTAEGKRIGREVLSRERGAEET